jgi:hypothetical protein
LHLFQRRPAVVSLVRDHFLDSSQMDSRLLQGLGFRLSLDQFSHSRAGLRQSFLHCGGVAQMRFLQRHCHYRAGLHVHGVFGLVRQVRTSILHLGDAGVTRRRRDP